MLRYTQRVLHGRRLERNGNRFHRCRRRRNGGEPPERQQRECYSVASLSGMNGKRTHDTPPIQSLDRGLVILEAVAASSDPVPLKHLTDLIGIDRSSVFRLANTLRQRKFLANPKGSKDYILGPSAWRLSRRHGRTVLGTFFHHYLQELSAILGETSHFAGREGVEVFFIDHHIPAGQVVSVAGQTGEFAPLHCTAHGKALLADCDLPALREMLGRT